MTHWDGCWKEGKSHYECAMRRIRELEEIVKLLSQLDEMHKAKEAEFFKAISHGNNRK